MIKKQFLIHYLEVELYREKIICSGTKDDKGKVAGLKDCIAKCRSVASMLILARKRMPGSSCSADYPCSCKCEIETTEDGKCQAKELNNGYDLFRYTGK